MTNAVKQYAIESPVTVLCADVGNRITLGPVTEKSTHAVKYVYATPLPTPAAAGSSSYVVLAAERRDGLWRRIHLDAGLARVLEQMIVDNHLPTTRWLGLDLHRSSK